MNADKAFKAQLDSLGETQVRTNLALNHYNDERRLFVVGWLDQVDRARAEAKATADFATAISAKDAAWAAAEAARSQAIEAKRANLSATIALIIAAISLVISTASTIYTSIYK